MVEILLVVGAYDFYLKYVIDLNGLKNNWYILYADIQTSYFPATFCFGWRS